MFKQFMKDIQEHFELMQEYNLFEVDLSEDELWEKYLGSFPEGTNPIWKERTEHDCNCCKNFIRRAGKMVALVNGNIVSIWDVETVEPYQTVADELSSYVHNAKIKSLYFYNEKSVGSKPNPDLETGYMYYHFYLDLPEKVCTDNVSELKGNFASKQRVF